MLALSIRQPWASLILSAGKNVENRGWPASVRGRILIHAAARMTRADHEDALAFAVAAIRRDTRNHRTLPRTLREMGMAFEDLPRGGIVGTVEIADCVTGSDSPWFTGPYGFMLRNPRPLPFVPWRGRLGFFDVPKGLVLI